MQSGVKEAVETAKRACIRCNSHKTFNPNEEDREIAKKACKRAHTELNNTFDEMRREDSTTIEQLNALKEAKRLCLDAMDDCDKCDKDRPRIREKLINIK